MLPGRMISWDGAVCFGATTETEGTASCVVTERRFVSALTRDLIPTANTPTPARATMAAMSQRVLDRPLRPWFRGQDATVSICSETCVCLMSITRGRGLWLRGEEFAVLCRLS